MGIGRSIPRRDGLSKIIGEAEFTGDLDLPRMLHAKILRSPHAHARVVRFDASEAKRMPGVKLVMSHLNGPRSVFGGIPSILSPTSPEDQPVFGDVVRFAGEPVAAVVANEESTALEALDQIVVEYERLPAVFDAEQSVLASAPKVHGRETKHVFDGDHNIASYSKSEYGRVDRALARSWHVGSEKYSTLPVSTSSLERSVTLAEYRSGRMTIWCPAQLPMLKRSWLSKILKIPAANITVRVPYVGGAFGGRTDLHRDEAICAVLAKSVRRPVRLELSRMEMLSAGEGRRHPATIYLKVGVSKEGVFSALEAKVYTNTGAYCPHGVGVTNNMVNMFHSLYRFPNYRAEGYCVYTNSPPAGGFRGYGFTEPTFAIESMVNVLADELKIDPLELRRRNHVRLGDVIPWSNTEIRSCALDECARLAGSEIGWERRDQHKSARGGLLRGMGVSYVTHHTSLAVEEGRRTAQGGPGLVSREFANAVVSGNDDGTFRVSANASELGSGQHTVLCQVASEELGVPDSKILFEPMVDTDTAPLDLGPAVDRCTFVTGFAVKKAAEDARRQILEGASKLLGVKAAALRLEGERVLTADGSRSVPLRDAMKFTNARLGPITGKGYHKPLSNAPSFGAVFSEVTVDAETGQITVDKIVGAFDVGTMLNPMLVESQTMGALAMGLSSTLMEGLLMDPETGTTTNPSFADYVVMGSTEIPDFGILHAKTSDPAGPFGAKGVGQMPVDGVPASIADAVFRATGVRITSLPMTSEGLWQQTRAGRVERIARRRS